MWTLETTHEDHEINTPIQWTRSQIEERIFSVKYRDAREALFPSMDEELETRITKALDNHKKLTRSMYKTLLETHALTIDQLWTLHYIEHDVTWVWNPYYTMLLFNDVQTWARSLVHWSEWRIPTLN